MAAAPSIRATIDWLHDRGLIIEISQMNNQYQWQLYEEQTCLYQVDNVPTYEEAAKQALIVALKEHM